MEQLLARLSWHKVGIILTNTRNVYAREHPLSIFEAVFKQAATRAGLADTLDYVFRTPGYTPPERIRKRREYPLELVFFRAGPEAIGRFLAALQEHLENPRNNFTCSVTAPLRRRTLADLLAEHGPLPEDCRELCLDFHTPFPFTPARRTDNSRYHRNLVGRDQFFILLRNRVCHAFALDEEALPLPDLDRVRILPYYWNYHQFAHRPKSSGGKELINGAIGPLYIKGEIAPLYPLLLLCSEINASRRPSKGRGCCSPVRQRPFFDVRLRLFSTLKTAFNKLKKESDLLDELLAELIEPESFLRECHREIVEQTYRVSPFSGFTIPKKKGGQRLIASAAPVDHLVLKMVHSLISPTLERMFEDCSIGFRRGRSRGLARRAIAAAVRKGYGYVLESDIHSFFDEVDWQVLTEKLHRYIPMADPLLLGLLEQFIRAELVVNNRPQARTKGLIQGMSLSPLLANLYLDSFDEEMTALGYYLVRYGDDFVVMARDEQEARQARTHADAILRRLGLRLNEDKTALTRFDRGFSFLGFDFGPGLDEEFIDRTALRKTVFVRSQFGFVGIDSDTIVVKKDRRTLASFPVNRVGEVVIFGSNTVSARLLHRCAAEGIPVSFCLAGGRYVSTLRPDSKKYFALTAAHSQKFTALTEDERMDVAKRIVQSKLEGYIGWLGKRYGARAGDLCALLRARAEAMLAADRVASVRGYEGEAANRVYDFLRTVTVDDFFLLAGRHPREKCDPANVLLDFASFLFFSRINVLLRSQGLNPYLGFLHSHRDNYESLVCDLQEPFRARTDRFVLKCVNRRIIRLEHFESSHGRYSLTRKGVGVFLEAFERELGTRLRGDGGTLKQLLVAQVQVVRMWVLDPEQELFFYHP